MARKEGVRPKPNPLGDEANCRSLGHGLQCCGLAAAASDRLARHLRRASVAEIGLLGAAPGVAEGQAEHRAAVLLDFLAAPVADEDGLLGHEASHVSVPCGTFCEQSATRPDEP